MPRIFLYGSLRDDALRAAVLGREAAGAPARAPGFEARWVHGDFPTLVARPGAAQEGLVFDDMSAEEIARLDFYEAEAEFTLQQIALEDGPARAWIAPMEGEPAGAEPGGAEPGARFELADWQAGPGPRLRLAAREFMTLFGTRSAAEADACFPTILMRADAALRALGRAPAPISAGLSRDDVTLLRESRPHVTYFALAEDELRHRRFDGGQSAPLRRAGLIMADAVTVLPYDPARDRVLVIEQFRFGAYVRGDAHPWLIEPVAGRIDPGEGPEDTARREAVEEAGLALGALYKVGEYYPTAGAASEYIYSYVGLADLPDGAAGLHGLEGEGEDIRGHVLSFEALMEIVDAGGGDTGPLMLSALWLARHRGRLRAGPGAGVGA